jgi:hypothetical protein
MIGDESAGAIAIACLLSAVPAQTGEGSAQAALYLTRRLQKTMNPRCPCFGLLGSPNPSFRVSLSRTMSTSYDSSRLVLCSGTSLCFFHLHSVLPPGQHTPSLLPSSSAALRCQPSPASCSCSLCVRDQATLMLLQPILQRHTHILDTRLVLPSSSDVDRIRRLRFLRLDQRQCLHMQSIGCAS